ncbi:carbohydrate esterase family 9 protein [Oidiodendron maius Zn]|uniref:N-acetylglucosamine-6-phosphate deacetylase n=1 Tax=Oidiodendron maius (strain Zn) TaxID=913774 RepID=A0A0C3HUN9_OIDMZ|nr:carbohydrate esterase family 9 protein [Oidiodendron maius Zn]
MPSAILTARERITKFTNCRLVRGTELVEQDLWVSSGSGKIVRSQEVFYGENIVPDTTIDLGGRIISPGMIDVQLNGAYGFNFSQLPEPGMSYEKSLRQVNKSLVQTGVTSYLPTVTSEQKEVYHHVLPFLGPSKGQRVAEDGAESLGAHVEGPFLNPTKNGIHKVENLITAGDFSDLEDCYGASNINPGEDPLDGSLLPPRIKMITAAPELGSMSKLIPSLTSRGIIFSMGHTEASYEDASLAVSRGCTMITHLFNAMRPLHHRNPGVFGVLGLAESQPRPSFGIIADGIHLHPTSVKIAFNAHPDGFVLVTDAMHLVGLPDGTYDWTNGERITKIGARLVLEADSSKIAGSSIALIGCVNNFLAWSGASIPQALKAVTATPAGMLGLAGVKGSLDNDADADLCIFSEEKGEHGELRLVVDQVWKFGTKVFDRLQ